jgi:hypothetical protein
MSYINFVVQALSLDIKTFKYTHMLNAVFDIGNVKEMGFICDVSYTHIASTFRFNARKEAALSPDMSAAIPPVHGTKLKNRISVKY